MKCRSQKVCMFRNVSTLGSGWHPRGNQLCTNGNYTLCRASKKKKKAAARKVPRFDFDFSAHHSSTIFKHVFVEEERLQ